MQQADNKELLNNGAPQDGQTPKMYSDLEYKNAQAFWTKARQNEIAITKKLVQKDPKELKSLDVEMQNKVIKDIYGYDNIEELEIMLPSIFEEWDKNQEDDIDLKQQVKLLQYQQTKKLVEDEVAKQIANSEALKAVPDLTLKINEELKTISSELPIETRVKKAIALISAENNIVAEAFLAMQGRRTIKANEEGQVTKPENNLFNNIRQNGFN